MKKILLLVFTTCFMFAAHAQVNLISNPGFEQYGNCPNYGAQWDLCMGWNNVNMNTGVGFWGTPDYFNYCASSIVNPPNTFSGPCYPHAGSAMMALVLYNVPYPQYREYLSTQLSCPMQPGATYTLSFWVSNGLNPISPWTVKNIGVHFSASPLSQTGFNAITSVTPQCEVTGNIASTTWVQYTFTVNPTTTWNYLTIGSFRTDAENAPVQSFPNVGGPASSYANYFIDDIGLIAPSSGNIMITNSAGSTNLCAGQSAILSVPGNAPYLWSTGSTSQSITVSPTVTTLYTATVTTGCTSNTAAITLSIVPATSVTVTASAAQVCPGESVTLTASGAGNYSWSTGQAGNASIVVSPTAATVYTVTGNTACGTTTATVAIGISNSPLVTISASPNCLNPGQSSTLTATGAVNYVWSTGQTGSGIVVSPTVATVYTVTGSSSCGTSDATVTVSMGSLPVITVTGPAKPICPGQTASLTATGANFYIWSSGQTGAAITVAAPNTTTSYTVTGTTSQGCRNSAVYTLSVDICTGIQAYATNNAVKTYPNPVGDVLSLELATADFNSLEVLNSQGAIIRSYTNYDLVNGNNGAIQVNLESVSKGMYFIRIESNNQVITQKFLKD